MLSHQIYCLTFIFKIILSFKYVSARISKVKYRRIGNLLVEEIEENIIECLQKWAFIDAFAILIENKDKIDLNKLYKDAYWKRISKTNTRAKQALEYGFHQCKQ